MNAYDAVPYENQPYAQTHPDRLCALARLHGLNPAPIEHARVLELGASEGGNLIPMAMTLPQAEFTGLDLAPLPVQRANEIIRDLAVANVRVLQMNILHVDTSFGEFEYILVHGMYAWTPPVVRDKILAIAGANLSANGIAFVSYNTYPGGYVRMQLREAMLECVGDVVDPQVRLEKARQMMRWMAVPRPQADPFDVAFAKECAEMIERPDSSLYHDFLAESYQPAYLRDFVRHAQQHQLEYVCDANVLDTYNPRLAPELVEEVTAAAGGSRIAREQFLDILRHRHFRQSLLCRAECPVKDEWQPEALIGMYVGSPATESLGGVFTSTSGVTITTEHPEVVALLGGLIRIWPRYQQIETGANNGLILELYRWGMVELHCTPGSAMRPGERPEAFRFARYQAGRGEGVVTTLDHRSLVMGDQVARDFLTKLDGTRDRTTLAREMKCTEGELSRRLDALGRYSLLRG